MRNTLISILCFLMLFVSEVYAMEWEKAQLQINEVDPERGGHISIYVFLEEGFPIKHEKAIKHYTMQATYISHNINIEVPDVPFAIKIHHDEDSSGDVTKNWTGFIPAEGLGFSSGAKLGFGPPGFDDAVMTLPETGKVSVSIIYP